MKWGKKRDIENKQKETEEESCECEK